MEVAQVEVEAERRIDVASTGANLWAYCHFVARAVLPRRSRSSTSSSLATIPSISKGISSRRASMRAWYSRQPSIPCTVASSLGDVLPDGGEESLRGRDVPTDRTDVGLDLGLRLSANVDLKL